MITSLLEEAYRCDLHLWVENQTLKYKSTAGSLTPDLLQQLKDNKTFIIARLNQNETMKRAGWLTYRSGEAYSKTITQSSMLFMFRESEHSFCVWRGTWRQDKSTPISERTIVNEVNFITAFQKAESYYSFLTSQKRAV